VVCEVVEAWDAEDGHPMVISANMREGLIRAEFRFEMIRGWRWAVNPVDCDDECEECDSVRVVGEAS
jgi:hypothetical protein